MLEKLFPDLLKMSKFNISQDQYSTVVYSLVALYARFRVVEILKLSGRPLAFISCKAFLENKKRSGTKSPCLIFCIIYEEKIFLLLYSMTRPNVIVWWFAFTSRDIGL